MSTLKEVLNRSPKQLYCEGSSGTGSVVNDGAIDLKDSRPVRSRFAETFINQYIQKEVTNTPPTETLFIGQPHIKRQRSRTKESSFFSAAPSSFKRPSTMNINDIWLPDRITKPSSRARVKVPIELRRRAQVACDNCRTRKTRCSGGRPCVKCSQASQVCRYPPSVARIVVDETLVERLQARCEALENCLFEVIPERQLRDDIAGRYGLILRPGINIGPERSGEGQPHWGSHSSNSGEGDEEDYLQVFLPGPVGYISFIGDSAGGTFIERIREYIQMTISWTLATPHGNDARMSPGYTNLNQGASMYSGNVSIAESYESCHPAEIPESLPCLPSYPSQVQGRAVDLSLPVTDQYVLPPKAVVVDLINAFTRYCGYGGPAESVSAIGGIYHWFDSQQLAVDIDSIYNFNEAPGSLGHSPLCMVNAILALSCQFLATSREDHAQMGKPTGTNWHAWTESTSNRSSSMSGSISPVSHMYAPSSPGPATSRSTPESASFGPGRRKQSSTSDLHLQPGIIYFARAKSLLDNPCDEPSLSTMRVLSLFSSLLLSLSQWDLAYHYIGLAVRIAVAHGLHRKKQRADIANSPSGYFDADERTEEERKRSFWNVYILDRQLSCLTGRPIMLHDDEIDVDWPTNVNGLPSAIGLRAHAELSKIMGEVVSNVYPIPKAMDSPGVRYLQTLQAIEKVHSQLQAWHDKLPSTLRLDNGPPERGVLLLHVLYNDILLMTTRPNLLLAVKQHTSTLTASTYSGQNFPQHLTDDSSICLQAARRNVSLANQLQGSGLIANLSFTDCNFVFNAGIILLLARLLPHTVPELQQSQLPLGQVTDEPDQDMARYAICYLSSLGKRGNEWAHTCARTLEELDSAISHLVGLLHTGSTSSVVVGGTQLDPSMPGSGAFGTHITGPERSTFPELY